MTFFGTGLVFRCLGKGREAASGRRPKPRPMLDPRRFLGKEPLATRLYQEVRGLPLVCPHGHVEPSLLADPEARFPDPVELFLRPDHYLLRMLYSQGLELEPYLDPESDPEKLWADFARHYHLFWGTPSGVWLDHQLHDTFGIDVPLQESTASQIYHELARQLAGSDFRPRALYERFGIEVLCTTDAATDSLDGHRRLREEGWRGRMLPTFRPDRLLWAGGPDWLQEVSRLGEMSGLEVTGFKPFLEALWTRRATFKELGCVATDHGAETPFTEKLSKVEAERLFEKALGGEIDHAEATRLQAGLLLEMAAMSVEDGLVMQLHPGSLRNHNTRLFERHGPDRGADIPVATEFTRNLRPLLEEFGHRPELRLIVFTLDESTYARELAPLAGHYPALLLGPPWWFHDSPRGMLRYFDQVMETAGVFNTAGFNDDTRAFCSIPARHDLWRRVSCRWLAEQVADGVLTEERASRLARELSYDRARQAYRLEENL